MVSHPAVWPLTLHRGMSFVSQGSRLDWAVSSMSHASLECLLFCWTPNPDHLKTQTDQATNQFLKGLTLLAALCDHRQCGVSGTGKVFQAWMFSLRLAWCFCKPVMWGWGASDAMCEWVKLWRCAPVPHLSLHCCSCGFFFRRPTLLLSDGRKLAWRHLEKDQQESVGFCQTSQLFNFMEIYFCWVIEAETWRQPLATH